MVDPIGGNESKGPRDAAWGALTRSKANSISLVTCLVWHSLGGAELPQAPISARATMMPLLSHRSLISRMAQQGWHSRLVPWPGHWCAGCF